MNCVGNKVKNLVKCYNMCAREFIRKLLRPGKVEDTGETTVGTDGKRRAVQWAATGEDADGEPPSGAVFDHVTMNLPATASSTNWRGYPRGFHGRRLQGCVRPGDVGGLNALGQEGRRVRRRRPELPVIRDRRRVYTFKRAMETVEDVVRRSREGQALKANAAIRFRGEVRTQERINSSGGSTRAR